LNLTIQYLYLRLSILLFLNSQISILLTVRSSLIIRINELDELITILLKLITRVLKCKCLSILLLFKFLYLFLNGVVWKFNQEHLFLLINELTYVLWTLFSWELYSGLSNVHCSTNITSLSRVKVIYILLTLHWLNISVLNSLKRHSWCGSLLVPYFKMFGCFFIFLFSLLLCFTRNKYLLFIWWTERRVFLGIWPLEEVTAFITLWLFHFWIFLLNCYNFNY